MTGCDHGRHGHDHRHHDWRFGHEAARDRDPQASWRHRDWTDWKGETEKPGPAPSHGEWRRGAACVDRPGPWRHAPETESGVRRVGPGRDLDIRFAEPAGPHGACAADAEAILRLIDALVPIDLFDPDIGTQVFSFDGETFTNLTAEIGRGFGSTGNRYSWDSEIFQGDLYISTWNLQLNYIAALDLLLNDALGIDIPGEYGPVIVSEGAQIWRRVENDWGGETGWEQVAGPGLTDGLDTGDTGIRSLVGNEKHLFAGAANGSFLGLETGSENPVKLFKSSDGETWELVPGGPGDDPGNTSIRALDIDAAPGKLFVGTEKQDASQIWSYDLHSGAWTLIAELPVDAIGWFETFDEAPGSLFVGTWDDAGYGIYALDLHDGSIANVTPTQFLFEGEIITPGAVPPGVPDPFDNPWLMEFISFKGVEGSHLYAGTGELDGVATMFRSDDPLDPKSWELITADGFGSPNNYFWTFEESGGHLYTGTFAGIGNVAQLYRTANGVDWEQIPVEDVVGPSTYGIRTSTGEDGELFLGTASSFLIPDFSKPPYPDTVQELLDNLGGLGDGALASLLSGVGEADPEAGASALLDALAGLDLEPAFLA